jgi:hypothetical protein
MKNPSHKPKNTSQAQVKPQGATSLLLVIGMALVFIVMITGLTSLSIRQSRQASNTDLSNRARATAEASARDAALWIQANPGKDYPDCNSTDPLSAYKPTADLNNTTEIVCRTITVSSPTPSGQIKKDESVQLFTYEPTPATGIGYMFLEWSKADTASAQYSTLCSAGGTCYDAYPTNIGSSNAYNINSPATLELSLVYWKKTDSSITSMPQKTSIIIPLSNGIYIAGPGNGSQVPSSSCANASSGYNCKVGINLSKMLGLTAPDIAANYNIVAKLKPRYKDTDYRASFCANVAASAIDCGIDAVKVRSSRALIDVTAKVGSLYRRIKAETEIGGSSFFDDVLYSNSPIDKSLTVCNNFIPIRTGSDYSTCELQ